MAVFRPKEYRRPRTVPEALSLLSQYRNKARVLAGGTDLLVQKPSGVDCLIDVAELGLDYIRKSDGGIAIGAGTKVGDIEFSPILTEGAGNVLRQAAQALATPTIRNMATIGGNICNASPAADLSVALMAVKAVMVVAGVYGTRTVPISAFFEAAAKTNLKEDELLIEIKIPWDGMAGRACFLKMRRHPTAVDLAVVNVAVRLKESGKSCDEVTIALGAVATTPIYAGRAEALIGGRELTPERIADAAREAANECRPIDDIRGTATYRKSMVEVYTRRALQAAWGGKAWQS